MTTNMLIEHDLLAKEDCCSAIKELENCVVSLAGSSDAETAASVCMASRMAVARYIAAFEPGETVNDGSGERLLQLLEEAGAKLKELVSLPRVAHFASNTSRRKKALEYYLLGDINAFRKLLNDTICQVSR